MNAARRSKPSKPSTYAYRGTPTADPLLNPWQPPTQAALDAVPPYLAPLYRPAQPTVWDLDRATERGDALALRAWLDAALARQRSDSVDVAGILETHWPPPTKLKGERGEPDLSALVPRDSPLVVHEDEDALVGDIQQTLEDAQDDGVDALPALAKRLAARQHVTEKTLRSFINALSDEGAIAPDPDAFQTLITKIKEAFNGDE